MFTSQGVVAKNSLTYKVWLVGISRKQLKRQDLEVDIGPVIEAVEKLGMNLQTISMCTLGIVKIHHGKACVLLSDCQRASEFARCLKVAITKDPGAKVEKKRKQSVIAEFDAMGDLPSQQSCYMSDDKILPTTSKAQITINEVLPMSQFTISNYQDFGDEGQLDFEMSYSQVFNQQDSQVVAPKEDNTVSNCDVEPNAVSEDVFEDIGGMDYSYDEKSDEKNNKEENIAVQIAPDESEEDRIEVVRDAPNSFVNDFHVLAPSDVDAEISEHGTTHADVEIPSMMDLDSLKSYASSVKSEKRRSNRKRRSIYDDEIIIRQFDMREQMNDFSDLVLESPDIAPPTRKLMKIRKESTWESLLVMCHVNGVKSQKGPPARMVNFLSRRAMESKRFRCYRVPTELEDIFDILDAQRNNGSEMPQGEAKIENAVEKECPKVEIVEKWLETNEIENGNENVGMEIMDPMPMMDLDPIIEEIEGPPKIEAVPDEVDSKEKENIENVAEGKKKNLSRKRKLKMVDLDQGDDDEETPLKRIHLRFINVLEDVCAENGSILLDDVIEKVHGGSTDRKEAARVFMTLLELKKMGKVEVSQDEPNGPILVEYTPKN